MRKQKHHELTYFYLFAIFGSNMVLLKEFYTRLTDGSKSAVWLLDDCLTKRQENKSLDVRFQCFRFQVSSFRFQVSSNPPPYPFVLRYAIESPPDFLHPLQRAGERCNSQPSTLSNPLKRAGKLRSGHIYDTGKPCGFFGGRAGASLLIKYRFFRKGRICTKKRCANVHL